MSGRSQLQKYQLQLQLLSKLVNRTHNGVIGVIVRRYWTFIAEKLTGARLY